MKRRDELKQIAEYFIEKGITDRQSFDEKLPIPPVSAGFRSEMELRRFMLAWNMRSEIDLKRFADRELNKAFKMASKEFSKRMTSEK
jgi:hypothetical protein